MRVKCDCILLDIEGTTSSISFVHDEMFPYVRQNVDAFLEANWNSESVQESIRLIASDAELSDWPSAEAAEAEQRQQVVDEVNRQMDQDLKATGLKDLQGKIWQSGFDSGALKAHLYEDTKPAITSWKDAGKDVRIYSSGSVKAQLLFFGHTVAGNLLGLFSAHYDTQIGGKKEAASYVAITEDIGIQADRILFISDIPDELDAAQKAGLQTALSIRPGNQPVTSPHNHPTIHSFAEIELE